MVAQVPDAAASLGRRKINVGGHSRSSVKNHASLAQIMGGTPGQDSVGVALSPEEAAWQARNGWIAHPNASRKYMALDINELEALAQEGDVSAATIGAKKAWVEAFHSDEGQRLHDATDSANSGAQSNWSGRRQAAKALFSSNLWQQRRRMLWAGVVHGSSWAAVRMAWTYMDYRFVCYKPTECAGWMLVAWRMGQWEVTPLWSVPPDEQQASLASAINAANIDWERINAARLDLGLEALNIDLRPNYAVWHKLRDQWLKGDQKNVPVYAR